MIEGLTSVAIIAAHPDDEVLGFGGTMHRISSNGGAVSVLILATGLAARQAVGTVDPTDLTQLREHAENANTLLGVRDLQFADFPDNRMDTVALLDVVQRVEAFLEGVRPDAVFTHHVGDINVDHQITSKAVQTACRSLPGFAPTIIHGEVLSSTEYALSEDQIQPNLYVELGASLEKKVAAMACYKQELRDFPHPRSLEAIRTQAVLRGTQCGVSAAEAFRMVRKVITL
jgi:N-acetylglucosamine malate deacetylase 1